MGPSQEPSTIERISIIANASEREGIPRFYYSLRSNVCVCRAKRPHQQRNGHFLYGGHIARDRAGDPKHKYTLKESERPETEEQPHPKIVSENKFYGIN